MVQTVLNDYSVISRSLSLNHTANICSCTGYSEGHAGGHLKCEGLKLEDGAGPAAAAGPEWFQTLVFRVYVDKNHRTAPALLQHAEAL